MWLPVTKVSPNGGVRLQVITTADTGLFTASENGWEIHWLLFKFLNHLQSAQGTIISLVEILLYYLKYLINFPNFKSYSNLPDQKLIWKWEICSKFIKMGIKIKIVLLFWIGLFTVAILGPFLAHFHLFGRGTNKGD